MPNGPKIACKQGLRKKWLHELTRHIAATRAGDDDRPIVQQADFAFGAPWKPAVDANEVVEPRFQARRDAA